MRGKALNVQVFDFKGRPLGRYRTASECAKDIHVHSSTIYRHVKDGKPLKRNGMTFDEADEE